jgi:hypothetical protein
VIAIGVCKFDSLYTVPLRQKLFAGIQSSYVTNDSRSRGRLRSTFIASHAKMHEKAGGLTAGLLSRGNAFYCKVSVPLIKVTA